jgi:hypothetical protein
MARIARVVIPGLPHPHCRARQPPAADVLQRGRFALEQRAGTSRGSGRPVGQGCSPAGDDRRRGLFPQQRHARRGHKRHPPSYPSPRKARFQVLVRLSWAGFHAQGSDQRFLNLLHLGYSSSSKLLGTTTLWCKKCIRSRRVHEAVRVQIRKNRRIGRSKDPRVPAAVLQIRRGQEREFDIQGDAKFAAPSTAALAF